MPYAVLGPEVFVDQAITDDRVVAVNVDGMMSEMEYLAAIHQQAVTGRFLVINVRCVDAFQQRDKLAVQGQPPYRHLGTLHPDQLALVGFWILGEGFRGLQSSSTRVGGSQRNTRLGDPQRLRNRVHTVFQYHRPP